MKFKEVSDENFKIFLLIYNCFNSFRYDWPIGPDTVQHVITSVMGEYRPGHFHRGVDIDADSGTAVYAIEGDTIYKDTVPGSPGANIGHFRYFHIIVDTSIRDSTYISADSFFAWTDTADHVHLQEADVELRHPGNLDNVNWLNPLRNGALTPYGDSGTAYPEIRDTVVGTDTIPLIKAWRQGTDSVIGLLAVLDTFLNRKIDISVDARDPWTNSNGQAFAGRPGNMGVYKVYAYILNRVGDTLKKFEYHKYDTCPPDDNLSYAYAPGSSKRKHIYFVTNNPWDTIAPWNYYWNTKQKINAPDSVDADSIEECLFPDGFYQIIVRVEDIRNNFDEEIY